MIHSITNKKYYKIMKTYSVKIEFSRPLDYDGLSDEVIISALKRYEEEIAEYQSFPR